jgi:RNA polymerase sigma-70 factor (ECF subfamily)
MTTAIVLTDEPQAAFSAAARDESASPSEDATYTAETLNFDSLYRDCSRQIFNFVLRSARAPQDAEDICQEVWANVYRRLPTIREAGAARVWLYRVARNAIIDAERRKARAPKQGVLVVEPAADPSGEPLHALIASEQVAFTWQALAALQPRQRMALYLKEVEGRCYREIAELLGCSESAVETLLFRARKRFADRYGCLAESRAGRCLQARRTMAIVQDGEGTAIEQRALHAHLDECEECRQALDGASETATARACLPLLPLGFGAPLLGLGGSLAVALESARSLAAPIVVALAGKATLAAGTLAVAVAIAATALTLNVDRSGSDHLEVASAPPTATEPVDSAISEDAMVSAPAISTATDDAAFADDMTSGATAILAPVEDAASGMVSGLASVSDVATQIGTAALPVPTSGVPATDISGALLAPTPAPAVMASMLPSSEASDQLLPTDHGTPDLPRTLRSAATPPEAATTAVPLP